MLIVIIFGLRSDKEREKPAATEDDVSDRATEIDEATPDVREGQLPPPEPTANENRAEVAAELAAELQSKRLWSEVEVEPGSDAMVIRTAYCEDAELKGAVQALAGRMTAEGVRKIECYERHGSLVFEQAL